MIIALALLAWIVAAYNGMGTIAAIVLVMLIVGDRRGTL
jgi:hypothetical protein